MANQPVVKKPDGPVTMTIVAEFKNMKDYYDWKEDAGESYLNSWGKLISATITGVPPILDVTNDFQ